MTTRFDTLLLQPSQSLLVARPVGTLVNNLGTIYVSADAVVPTYVALWDSAGIIGGGGGTPTYQANIPVQPLNTISDTWYTATAMTVAYIVVWMTTLPTTAGTYTLAVENLTGAVNLLNAATFDLTNLMNDLPISLQLSAVAGALDLAAGDRVRASFASDNGDLTGSGLYWAIG